MLTEWSHGSLGVGTIYVAKRKETWKKGKRKLTKLRRPQNSEYSSPQCNYSVSTHKFQNINKPKETHKASSSK